MRVRTQRRATKKPDNAQEQLVIADLRVCVYCGVESADDCVHDRTPRDYGDVKRRPKGCLNAYDPWDAQIPF